MRKSNKQLIGLFLRYILIVIAGLGNLAIFYKIFTPITTKALKLILNLFTPTTLSASTLSLPNLTIELIPACIAGSAYYLLFILNLATPGVKPDKRIKILLLSFASIFVMNTLRILLLIAINQTAYFQAVHWFFWYVLSTIFVIAIWVFITMRFKIKKIPVYEDLKFLYGLVR